MRQILSSTVLFLGLFLVTGCGPGKVIPSGKVVQSGKPVTLSDKGVLIVTFYAPDDKENANPFATRTKPDGTFTIVGRDGKGIVPGKYRVAVEAQDPYPGNDKLKGKFTASKTNLTVEVGQGEVVIDVGK